MPVHELFDPNAYTPDPCALHAEALVELQRLRVDLDGDVGQGDGNVAERVSSVKSANRTEMVTVRPAICCFRIR